MPISDTGQVSHSIKTPEREGSAVEELPRPLNDQSPQHLRARLSKNLVLFSDDEDSSSADETEGENARTVSPYERKSHVIGTASRDAGLPMTSTDWGQLNINAPVISTAKSTTFLSSHMESDEDAIGICHELDGASEGGVLSDASTASAAQSPVNELIRNAGTSVQSPKSKDVGLENETIETSSATDVYVRDVTIDLSRPDVSTHRESSPLQRDDGSSNSVILEDHQDSPRPAQFSPQPKTGYGGDPVEIVAAAIRDDIETRSGRSSLDTVGTGEVRKELDFGDLSGIQSPPGHSPATSQGSPSFRVGDSAGRRSQESTPGDERDVLADCSLRLSDEDLILAGADRGIVRTPPHSAKNSGVSPTYLPSEPPSNSPKPTSPRGAPLGRGDLSPARGHGSPSSLLMRNIMDVSLESDANSPELLRRSMEKLALGLHDAMGPLASSGFGKTHPQAANGGSSETKTLPESHPADSSSTGNYVPNLSADVVGRQEVVETATIDREDVVHDSPGSPPSAATTLGLRDTLPRPETLADSPPRGKPAPVTPTKSLTPVRQGVDRTPSRQAAGHPDLRFPIPASTPPRTAPPTSYRGAATENVPPGIAAGVGDTIRPATAVSSHPSPGKVVDSLIGSVIMDRFAPSLPAKDLTPMSTPNRGNRRVRLGSKKKMLARVNLRLSDSQSYLAKKIHAIRVIQRAYRWHLAQTQRSYDSPARPSRATVDDHHRRRVRAVSPCSSHTPPRSGRSHDSHGSQGSSGLTPGSVSSVENSPSPLSVRNSPSPSPSPSPLSVKPFHTYAAADGKSIQPVTVLITPRNLDAAAVVGGAYRGHIVRVVLSSKAAATMAKDIIAMQAVVNDLKLSAASDVEEGLLSRLSRELRALKSEFVRKYFSTPLNTFLLYRRLVRSKGRPRPRVLSEIIHNEDSTPAGRVVPTATFLERPSTAVSRPRSVRPAPSSRPATADGIHTSSTASTATTATAAAAAALQEQKRTPKKHPFLKRKSASVVPPPRKKPNYNNVRSVVGSRLERPGGPSSSSDAPGGDVNTKTPAGGSGAAGRGPSSHGAPGRDEGTSRPHPKRLRRGGSDESLHRPSQERTSGESGVHTPTRSVSNQRDDRRRSGASKSKLPQPRRDPESTQKPCRSPNPSPSRIPHLRNASDAAVEGKPTRTFDAGSLEIKSERYREFARKSLSGELAKAVTDTEPWNPDCPQDDHKKGSFPQRNRNRGGSRGSSTSVGDPEPPVRYDPEKHLITYEHRRQAQSPTRVQRAGPGSFQRRGVPAYAVAVDRPGINSEGAGQAAEGLPSTGQVVRPPPVLVTTAGESDDSRQARGYTQARRDAAASAGRYQGLSPESPSEAQRSPTSPSRLPVYRPLVARDGLAGPQLRAKAPNSDQVEHGQTPAPVPGSPAASPSKPRTADDAAAMPTLHTSVSPEKGLPDGEEDEERLVSAFGNPQMHPRPRSPGSQPLSVSASASDQLENSELYPPTHDPNASRRGTDPPGRRDPEGGRVVATDNLPLPPGTDVRHGVGEGYAEAQASKARFASAGGVEGSHRRPKSDSDYCMDQHLTTRSPPRSPEAVPTLGSPEYSASRRSGRLDGGGATNVVGEADRRQRLASPEDFSPPNPVVVLGDRSSPLVVQHHDDNRVAPVRPVASPRLESTGFRSLDPLPGGGNELDSSRRGLRVAPESGLDPRRKITFADDSVSASGWSQVSSQRDLVGVLPTAHAPETTPSYLSERHRHEDPANPSVRLKTNSSSHVPSSAMASNAIPSTVSSVPVATRRKPSAAPSTVSMNLSLLEELAKEVEQDMIAVRRPLYRTGHVDLDSDASGGSGVYEAEPGSAVPVVKADAKTLAGAPQALAKNAKRLLIDYRRLCTPGSIQFSKRVEETPVPAPRRKLMFQ
eukprot:Rmarinus@m.21860